MLVSLILHAKITIMNGQIPLKLSGSLMWFSPRLKPSPIEPFAHTPGGIGKKIGKVKVRKFMGWLKDSLIGKAKVVHGNKAKKGIHSPLPMDRQVFQESCAPSCILQTSEDKCHHSKHFPILFPQLYMLSLTPYGMEYPFVQCRSAVPAVSSPNSLCTSSFLVGWVVWGAEKALSVCTAQQWWKHPYVIHTVSSQSKTQSHTSFYEEN